MTFSTQAAEHSRSPNVTAIYSSVEGYPPRRPHPCCMKHFRIKIGNTTTNTRSNFCHYSIAHLKTLGHLKDPVGNQTYDRELNCTIAQLYQVLYEYRQLKQMSDGVISIFFNVYIYIYDIWYNCTRYEYCTLMCSGSM